MKSCNIMIVVAFYIFNEIEKRDSVCNKSIEPNPHDIGYIKA